MATNLDVITAAYRGANIIDERATPSGTQGATGLQLLNDMMSDWEADGVELGYFPQTSVSATIPVEEENLRGIKANLIRAVAADAGFELSSEAIRIAVLTYARLQKRTTEEVHTNFDHMPGGGHHRYNINNG